VVALACARSQVDSGADPDEFGLELKDPRDRGVELDPNVIGCRGRQAEDDEQRREPDYPEPRYTMRLDGNTFSAEREAGEYAR
jgi:hypothetical protein